MCPERSATPVSGRSQEVGSLVDIVNCTRLARADHPLTNEIRQVLWLIAECGGQALPSGGFRDGLFAECGGGVYRRPDSGTSGHQGVGRVSIERSITRTIRRHVLSMHIKSGRHRPLYRCSASRRRPVRAHGDCFRSFRVGPPSEYGSCVLARSRRDQLQDGEGDRVGWAETAGLGLIR